MVILARALILTAATLAVWLYIVRWQARGGQANTCGVSYVYDGDTVALDCGGREVTARLQGLDAPETRDAGCEAERVAGNAATARLRALVRQGVVTYRRRGTDKYGRWLIRLSVDGQDVAERMIAERLAVPYAGGGRIDWCKRLGAA
ncbi:thermonuclease family protein [Marimonas arenosa]|uniref:Thermonuclease family protein n=1 Tax=Marimonas arenosa TaxID=1795305 RepID=A0AAE3WF39_9RHOB|nr:thermonuclease family protein [Marimonas arenosa]MDQ2091469.1 thermonuclease family protein [Marimonas arenosa]